MDTPQATRSSFQIGRRLFHMSIGLIIASTYLVLLDRETLVSLIGLMASLLYVFEQVRTNYPEYSSKLKVVNKYLLRAEEQLEESAAVPYSMAVLLTILTFPKYVAVISIFILAFADPMSAIIGIKFGTKKIAEGKSLQGSIAFLVTSFLCVLVVSHLMIPNPDYRIWILAILHSLLIAGFELIPLRIDDNLTIPIASALLLWPLATLFGIF